MAAGTHQHGDAFFRRFAAGLADDGQDATGLLADGVAAVALDDRMDDDAAIHARRPGRRRFGIAHGAGFRAVVGREDGREGRIDPIDDARIRAVVAEQAQVAEADVADAALADAQEEPDVGLAEAVDRLHRVADDEQRAAVVRHPAARQFLDQADLARTGVLEFIDQQVTDAVVERLGQIGRRFVIAERQAGAGGDFDEVDLAGFLKGQPQLPGGQPQQAGKTLDRGPLAVAQFGLRQLEQHGQRLFQPGDAAQFAEQIEHGLFLLGEFLVRRKTDALVDRLAQRAATGQ